MIRKGFSLYLVRSARYGTTLKLSKAIHKALVTLADTSPEVAEYSVGTPTFEYYDRGKLKQTTVPVSIVGKDGMHAFWDVAQYGASETASLAKEVMQAHARESGGSYELFDSDRLDRNLIEKKNRQSAQSLLYLAHGNDLTELQTQCLLALVAGPLTVGELAKRLATSNIKVTVVALRLWLGQKVELPMTTQYLQPSWILRRLDHAHR